MLEFYYTWCLIAFIFGLIWFLLCIYYYIFEKTNIETNNYKEIGLSYNLFSMWFVEGKVDWGNFIFGLFLCFWIWVLLSWISVIFYIFGLIKKFKWYFFDLPNDTIEEIKKMKLKLKNTKISTKREINEIVYFINYGQKIREDSDLSENLLLWDIDLSPINDERIHRHLYVYYNKLEYREQYTPWKTESIFNYKIEWEKVLARTIEICHSYPWEENYYPIKNWKVNEEAIKKDWESAIEPMYKSRPIKDIIKDYKDSLKWNKLRQDRVDYILYYNLSTTDFKKFAESNIDRLRIWKEKKDKIYDDIEKKYWDKKEWNEKKELISKRLEKEWFTYDELYSCEERIKRLEEILSWKIPK